jgi:hypothetical protein
VAQSDWIGVDLPLVRQPSVSISGESRMSPFLRITAGQKTYFIPQDNVAVITKSEGKYYVSLRANQGGAKTITVTDSGDVDVVRTWIRDK